MACNPEVAAARLDGLLHFLSYGIGEGRQGVPAIASRSPAATSSKLIQGILDSGLFDPAWYEARYEFVSATPEEAVEDYLFQSSYDPLRDPGPLFSGAHYLMQHPDIRGMHPLEHFVTFGLNEGRGAVSAIAADAFMEGAGDHALVPLAGLLDSDRRVVVLHWSQGNFFFSDIARYLVDYLSRAGYRAEIATDDAGFEPGQHQFVVVAPHEYCVHGPGAAWSDSRLAAAVYVNTEQWHTSWFSLALGKMLKSRKALDINPASARGLTRLGIAAGFLPLLPQTGGVFAFPRAPLSAPTTARRAVKPLTWPERFEDRPYDVLFVGALNDRREMALGQLAPCLAQYDCFIHSPRLMGPVNSGNVNMIPSADVAQLARNSRVLLNIHQGESRYFPWHRLFLSGICEGAVVVTEPCVATGVLVAGEHYLEVELAAMGEFLDRLLGTAAGLERMLEIRRNCVDLQARLQARAG